MQRFLEIAMDELGVHETPGTDATARIVEYHSTTTLKATSDEVAWCSSFANWVVKQSGEKGTGSAAARSWLDWGKPVMVPYPGCIVILERKTADNPHSAHVAFYTCDDKDPAYIQAIGGNQGDKVRMSRFPKHQIIGYRDV